MGIPLVQVLCGVQGNIGLVDEAPAATKAAASAQVVVLQEHEDVLLVNLDHAYLHGAQVHGIEGNDELLFVGQDVSLEGELDGRFLLFFPEDLLVVLCEGMAVFIPQAFIQGEFEVSCAAFKMHAEEVALYLDIAAGGSFKFYHAFVFGIGRDVAQLYFNARLGKGCLHHAEFLSVVRLGFFLDGRPGLAFNGDAVAEGFRSARDELSQCELYLIHQAFPQGTIGRNKTHGLAAVPRDFALDDGFDGEKAFRRHGGSILREIYPQRSVGGNDATGICLDVGGKILGRRFLCRLLGSAGGHEHCCGQH